MDKVKEMYGQLEIVRIRKLYDQLDMVRTRSKSISQSVNQFKVSELGNDKACHELLNSIDEDLEALQIHLSSAWDLIDYAALADKEIEG